MLIVRRNPYLCEVISITSAGAKENRIDKVFAQDMDEETMTVPSPWLS